MRHTHQKGHPDNGFDGIGRELREIGTEIIRRSVELTRDRCQHILQGPTRNHPVIADDQCRCEHAHVAHPFPRCAVGQFRIGTSRIGLCVPANEELTKHHGDTHDQDTEEIDDDEGRTTVLTCHVWKAPYVSQANSTACRGKDYS